MAKRVSTRGIKKHRLYTYGGAADVMGVTAQTVRSWRTEGLEVLAEKKPHFILGEALIEFLERRQKKRSFGMQEGQFFCLSCRMPQRPYRMMVDYVPINSARGRLVALCEVCEGRCQRFASEASLTALGRIFEIVTRSAKQA